MLKKLIFMIGAVFLASAQNSHAQPYTAPNVGPSSITSTLQTVFSLGVQWDFGDNRPDVVAAIRRTQTGVTSRVTGAKIDVSVPLTVDDGFQPRLRALVLAGNRAAQAEAGLGFRVNQNSVSPLVAAGVQLPYVNGGVNYVYRDGFKPYLGVNLLKRPTEPTLIKGTLSCTSGALVSAPLAADETVVIDGKTCQ